MRPMMSERMSTEFSGSIFPLAVTIATRSRRATFSSLTPTAGWRRFETPSETKPARTRTPPMMRTTLPRVLMDSCPIP